MITLGVGRHKSIENHVHVDWIVKEISLKKNENQC